MPFVQKRKQQQRQRKTANITVHTVGVQIGKNNKFVRMQLDQLTKNNVSFLCEQIIKCMS